jgi:NADH dehydrogenase (ubiquinone) 1 alpha subcomplex subunit 5
MVENNVPIPKHVPPHRPPPLPKERQKLEELVSKSRKDNAAASSSEEPSKP